MCFFTFLGYQRYVTPSLWRSRTVRANQLCMHYVSSALSPAVRTRLDSEHDTFDLAECLDGQNLVAQRSQLTECAALPENTLLRGAANALILLLAMLTSLQQRDTDMLF